MTKEDYLPPRPQFTPQISLGNIILVITILVGGVTAFTQLRAMSESNAAALQALQQAQNSLEIRIRSLETQQARSDERYTSILGLLSRIDTRLERIEAVGR